MDLTEYWADNGAQGVDSICRLAALTPEEEARLRRQAQKYRVPTGVRAPVVLRQPQLPVVLSRLVPAPAWPAYLSPATRASIEGAQIAAAQDLGVLATPGPVRLPALEALAPLLKMFQVQGSSLYAAAYLEFVARLSQLSPVKNVVVSGAPDEPIGSLEVKRGAAGGGAFYYLASNPSGEGHCLRPATLARQVWGYLPRRAGLGERVVIGTPSKISNLDGPKLALGSDDITPASVPDFLAKGVAWLQTWGEPVRLQVVGPVMLAAGLGWHLKNKPTEVVLLDNQGCPRWSSLTRLSLPAPSQAHPGRLAIGAQVEGFEWVSTPAYLDEGQVSDVVAQILAQLSPYPALELAIQGPQVLGFALALALKNVRRVTWLHYRAGQGYEPWPFE